MVWGLRGFCFLGGCRFQVLSFFREGDLVKNCRFYVGMGMIALGVALCDSPSEPTEVTTEEQQEDNVVDSTADSVGVVRYAQYRWAPDEEIQQFVGTNTNNYKLIFCENDSVIVVVDFSKPLVYDSTSGDSVRYRYSLKKPGGYENYKVDSPIPNVSGTLVVYWLHSPGETPVAFVQALTPDSEPGIISKPGTHPHWFIDPYTHQAYVVYTDRASVASGDLAPSVEGATYRRMINYKTGQLFGHPEEILDMPFIGGMSEGGRYIGTAENDVAIYDLNKNRLSIAAHSDTIRVQGTDPSMSNDEKHPDWMLFLPIGDVSELSYATSAPAVEIMERRYMMIVDKDQVVQWYAAAPSGYEQWRDPEWTNHPKVAIASAGVEGDSENSYDIFLVRMDRDANSTLCLSTGDAKFTATASPYFWIGDL